MRTLMGLFLIACLSVSTFAVDKVQIVRLPEGALQPQTIVDREGVLHVVYLSGGVKESDVYYVRSTDEGATFSKPVRVNSEEKSAIAAGAIRGAQLAVGDGKIHVAWNAGKGGAKAPLLYSRSTDGGKTFEPQRAVSGDHPGMDGGGSVAADESGRVIVAWHAQDTGKVGEENRRIWIAESTDGGKAFSTERAIDPPGDGVCSCCSIRAAFVKGAPVVFYRMAKDTTKRNMVAIDVKNGTTSQLAEVSVGQCVMSTVSYVEQGDTALAAWETNGKVEVGQLGDSMKVKLLVKLPDGKKQKYASSAIAPDGSFLVAWTEGNAWAAAGTMKFATYGVDGQMKLGSANPVFADMKLPVWSFPATFAKKDGSFVILY